ncbi:hypothetical protein CMQ_6943 [Grosmannia clavigera kw1407]|uniref:Uncharacterized protein n=1 Tax=Grosmannia clavigera (strain kw1407 / UAMH 11150) TaxID=655863 RepID=F0X7P1_GROCL|nr:uncharacterized protein CMQ_6943 [Grosmannia clavigera kw1407]EFX06622.1 hypothetical protein CMQ_6943 [Grosmannia clavigera kw1407]
MVMLSRRLLHLVLAVFSAATLAVTAPTLEQAGPPDPAFPFTDLCDNWWLERLSGSGEFVLWTLCPKGENRTGVVSVLQMDRSLVADSQRITPASPSCDETAFGGPRCRLFPFVFVFLLSVTFADSTIFFSRMDYGS